MLYTIPLLFYTQLAWNVLNDVLQGLEVLHRADLVHGAVHLNNVFVDDEGHAILADKDFSKYLVVYMNIFFVEYETFQQSLNCNIFIHFL